MTRWLITAGILGTFMLGAIMYIARPEVIEQQAGAVVAPIKRAIAEHEAEKYEKARQEAYRAWFTRHPTAADCATPSNALKQLECRNKEDQQNMAFERAWQQRIDSGWKPD